MNFFRQPFWSYWGVISQKLLIKSRNQKIFQKFELNRNLQRIPFKMMYNMSMLRGVNHLPLLFRKSVYRIKRHLKMIYTKGKTYQSVNLALAGDLQQNNNQLATRNSQLTDISSQLATDRHQLATDKYQLTTRN